jgi:hypothetical protein
MITRTTIPTVFSNLSKNIRKDGLETFLFLKVCQKALQKSKILQTSSMKMKLALKKITLISTLLIILKTSKVDYFRGVLEKPVLNPRKHIYYNMSKDEITQPLNGQPQNINL